MAETIHAFPLPADEQELLRCYRKLPREERATMHRVAAALRDVPATLRQPPRLSIIEGDRK